METGIDFAQELNEAQLEAVQGLEGPRLVIAGPGSGKTRTLVFRVAHLVEQGVPPEAVLLLTFTRKASQEMLRRATRILDERCRRVAGGTFHAFANLVLRRHGERLGISTAFTILDRSDAGDLIGILRAEGGYDRRRRRFPQKQTILDLISRHVNTHRPLETLVEEDFPQFYEEIEALVELRDRYARRKLQQNVLDYDDLLVFLRDLLAQHDEVRRELSTAYRYVMVDEYQDTNRLQAHIAALLASSHGNLMVVGDDAQSIYSFRGASFKNIIDFPKIFPQAQLTLLERNYRSTQPILDLANGILANAREKFSKKLFTEVPGDALPLYVRTPDEYLQARFLCRQILDLREAGVALSEIAVLVRAAWHSNTLEIELKNANVPFQKFGGLRFVEAAHVKDVSALLKVGVNPLDGAAWFRLLQLFEGIGPRTAQRLAQQVQEADGSLAPLTSPELAKKRFAAPLKGLASLVRGLGDPEVAVAERVEDAIAYYTPLMDLRYDDSARRGRDLEILPEMAGRYQNLEAFLSDIAIEPPELTRSGRLQESEDECMTISTVHSAKGLEWQAVFVIGLTEGQFPSFRSLGDDDAYEEERRLFYVAVTRAKRQLFLVQPERVPRRGPYGDDFAEPSSFLEEIDGFDRLVEERVVLEDPLSDALPEPADGGAASAELLDRINDYFSGG